MFSWRDGDIMLQGTDRHEVLTGVIDVLRRDGERLSWPEQWY